MDKIQSDTPLMMLTVSQFQALVASCFPDKPESNQSENIFKRYVWKNRARETLYSGCLLTLLDTKKRATKVAIKLTPARAILTGDFFRSFGFRPGRRGN